LLASFFQRWQEIALLGFFVFTCVSAKKTKCAICALVFSFFSKFIILGFSF